MNKFEDNLREVMRVQGCNIWTLIDTMISMAARDHHSDFLLRRDSIMRTLLDLSSCSNSKHPSNRANWHDHREGLDVTHVETNPIHVTVVSPKMQCETTQPESEESPEMVMTNIPNKQDVNTINQNINKILAMMDFLEDLDKSDEESLISILKNLGSIDVTLEVLKETNIGRVVNKLTKHGSSDVQHLAKQRIKEWKETVSMESKSYNSSSQAIQNEAPRVMINESGLTEKKEKPVRIKIVSSKKNGSDYRERQTKPSPTRPDSINGSDYLERRVNLDPVREKSDAFHEAPKRKEREELCDSARFDSARKRLKQNYQEAMKAKKQKTIQVMEIDEIPKPKNGFIRKSVPASKHK